MADKLYFDQTVVGNIDNSESDFLNFNGQFTTELKPSDKISSHILNYIDFSKRFTDLYLSDDQILEDLEQKLLEEENKYDDLINSNSWYILDNIRHRINILVPTFDFQNAINWRLNTD